MNSNVQLFSGTWHVGHVPQAYYNGYMQFTSIRRGDRAPEVQLTRDFLYVICPTSQVPLSLAVMCASAKHSPSNPAALPLA